MKKPVKKKKARGNYEKPLKIKGSFNDVLKASTKEKDEKKSSKDS